MDGFCKFLWTLLWRTAILRMMLFHCDAGSFYTEEHIAYEARKKSPLLLSLFWGVDQTLPITSRSGSDPIVFRFLSGIKRAWLWPCPCKILDVSKMADCEKKWECMELLILTLNLSKRERMFFCLPEVIQGLFVEENSNKSYHWKSLWSNVGVVIYY